MLVLLVAIGGAVACAVVMDRRKRQLERLLAVTDGRLMRLQRQFERFVPADVVERLTDVDDGFVPERRQVTIMFADLRGFTAMSERLDPAVTVDILNGYSAR